MISNYLTEIKNRGFLIFITGISTFFICYTYKEEALFLFIYPNLELFKTNFIYFISTDLAEIFNTNITISSFLSLQIVIVSIIIHTIIFIAPGLYLNEYFKLTFFSVSNLSICFISITILYNFLLPKSWEFFISFQQTLNNNIKIYFEAKLYNYIIFCITLYKIALINSQLLSLTLIYLINVNESMYYIKFLRKRLYYAIVIVSSIITPPDVISQIVVSIITILVYEIIIFIVIVKNKLCI